MSLVVIGVNHKTAPLNLRAHLAFGDDLPTALQSLKSFTKGATIVSTCNRSEIYALMDDDNTVSTSTNSTEAISHIFANDAFDDVDGQKIGLLIEWLCQFKQITPEQVCEHLYCYVGNLALTHWLRVGAGLDSMILGEPQILGQIKRAVAASHEQGVMSEKFNWLTQKIFAGVRMVRRDTKIGEQAVSLGFSTAKLVTQIFQNPKKITLLIVAAGEMNRLVAHNVAALGLWRVLICNRSEKNAKLLQTELLQQAAQENRKIDVAIFGLDALQDCLNQSDIVSSCSASMHALMDASMIKQAMVARKKAPMLLVDLAVPRDIDEACAKLDNVFLYSIDDLQHVIEGNMQLRKQAAIDAELLTSQIVSDIEVQWQIKSAGQTIARYEQASTLRANKHLERAKVALKTALDNGDDPTVVLEHLTHKLTRTLMHPQFRLLRAYATADDEHTLELATHILLNSHRKKC